MDYENLVEFLVEEIYRKIQEDGFKRPPLKKKKKSLVIVGESNVNKYKKVLDDFTLSPLTQECSECDAVLITKLCLKGLSNLALGSCNTKEESFVLEMLLKGKRVFVLYEGILYRRYKNTAPKVLYNKYIKFEEEIKSYGVEIIKDLSELRSLYYEEFREEKLLEEGSLKEDFKALKREDKEEEFKGEEVKALGTLDLSKKRLISEGDLRKPHIKGIKKLLLNKKAIITPLAKDYIRINHLEVLLS